MESVTTIVKNLVSRWWWLLFLLAALEAANSEYGEFALITFRNTQQFPLGGIGFFISMILNFILPVATFSVMIYLSQRKTTIVSFQQGLKETILENMRVYGKIFLSSFLLLVPGLIKYVRLSFVPFIVFMERDYQADRLDALKYSSALSRGYFWQLLGVAALFHLAPFLPWLLFGELKFRERFGLAFSAMLWTLAIELLAFAIVCKIYQSARQKLPASEGL